MHFSARLSCFCYCNPASTTVYHRKCSRHAENWTSVSPWSKGFTDVASLGVLPKITGGSLYRYSNFSTQLVGADGFLAKSSNSS